jgi:hypothetical protein
VAYGMVAGVVQYAVVARFAVMVENDFLVE